MTPWPAEAARISPSAPRPVRSVTGFFLGFGARVLVRNTAGFISDVLLANHCARCGRILPGMHAAERRIWRLWGCWVTLDRAAVHLGHLGAVGRLQRTEPPWLHGGRHGEGPRFVRAGGFTWRLGMTVVSFPPDCEWPERRAGMLPSEQFETGSLGIAGPGLTLVETSGDAPSAGHALALLKSKPAPFSWPAHDKGKESAQGETCFNVG